MVLPGAAYTEKAGLYVNTEGRVQTTRAAVPLLGDAREDWRIVRALSEVLGKPLPYDTQDALRARLADVAPHFGTVGGVQPATWLNGQVWKAAPPPGAPAPAPLTSAISNFYMTDAISRASATMAKCVQARQTMLYGR